jgi:hypothetical protein
MLLCAVLLAAPAFASEELLRDCSWKASGESVGLDALDADCPGVADAVSASEESVFISEGQTELLRRESLGDLVSLQTRYRTQAAAGPALDPTTVAAVLQGLPAVPPPPVKPKGWFELLEEWLKTLLSDTKVSDNWLSRWLKDVDIDGQYGTVLVVIMSLIILVVAIAIVVIELRASGIFLRRGTRFAVLPSATSNASVGLGLADLDAAPVGDRVPMLLKLLVTALRGAGRLESDRALTHRQLSGRARFDDAGQQQQFGDIAVLAERSVYGGQTLGTSELERAMQTGRTLYAQLSQPAAVRTSDTAA